MCTALVQVVDPNCYCDDAPPMVFCDEVIGCNTYALADPVEIKPDDFTIVELDVANDIIITDVNVSLSGSHPSTGDLLVELISPEMTSVVLFDGLCPGTTGFDVEPAGNSISYEMDRLSIQLSVKTGAIFVTTAPHSPISLISSQSSGQVKVGTCLSFTMTRNEH